MPNELQDFEQFMQVRLEAAQAFTNGDGVPVSNLVASSEPVTFFSPRGGYQQGSDGVLSQFQKDASGFVSGDTTFEVLQIAASDGIAYWSGFQKASAWLKGAPEPMEFPLLVTELFRRENGNWKLVHRHASLREAQNK